MMTLIEEKTAQSRKKLLEKEAACKKYSAAIDAAKIGEPR